VESNGQTRDPTPGADAVRRLRAVVDRLGGAAPPEVPKLRAELRVLADELDQQSQAVAGLAAELEEARKNAQAQRTLCQEMFEFTPDGCLMIDAEGIILEANHAVTALLEVRKEFLRGKPLAFFVSPAWHFDFYTRLLELRSPGTGTVVQWETSLKPAVSPPRSVLLTVTPSPFGAWSYGQQHRPGRVYRCLLRDVTPRREAEEAFLSEKDFADTLLDTVEAIILVVVSAGDILRSNRFLSTISGHTEDQLRGRDWCQLLLAETDRRRGAALVGRALIAGAARGEILGLVLRSGGQRTVAWSAFLLPDTRGGVPAGTPVPGRRVVLLGYDVTDLKEAEQRALQAQRLAVIGQTMAGLAHESRNALQRSQSGLEMLGWLVQDRPRAVELLGRVQKAQDDLLRLYEDVRNYAAPVNLRPEPVNLADVWREAWAQAVLLYKSPGAGASGLSEGCDAKLWEETGRLNLECGADRFHLVAVFRNLFDNSLAACPEPVRVTVACAETWLGARPALRVSVRDNGPGLNAEQRQNLFQPFYTTKVRGTGLGLAIVKRIIETHGGQIALGDVPNPADVRVRPGGTEIVITLPRGQS
jgi:PAS domain S-box-containing protein